MLADLATRLGARLGLQPLPSWEQDLARTLERLGTERHTTIEDLATQVDHDASLLRELTAAITVGETYFLRDAPQLEAALQHINKRADHPTISVWSAGCSTGEEPFSLAILLARHAPHLASRVRIRASDMSITALEQAHRGIYGPWSFRSTPSWLRRDFFTAIGQNEWMLAPQVRGRVEFCEESIQAALARTPPSSVDVILFRNVSIYAQPSALRQIFDGFHRILKHDGLLVEGVCDARPPLELFDAVADPVIGLFSPVSNHQPAPLPKTRTHRPSQTVHSDDSLAAPRSAPPLPPVSSGPSVSTNALQSAITHADRGDLQSAFECVHQVLASSPDDPNAHFVCGKLLLATRRPNEAVIELRQAIFLSPGHRLARFWIATALVEIDLPHKASLELAELNRRFVHADPAELLEDGTSRLEELMAAVNALQRTLS